MTAALLFAQKIVGNSQGCSSPDIHIICKEDVVWSSNPALQKKKQTNIPVDLLRERMIGGRTSDGKQHDSSAYKTPVSGDKKVFIIDEAELLDESGQNALLKTLEEPPLGTFIILVTSRDDALLQTIKSRCQPVYFSPLSSEEMDEWISSSPLKDDAFVSWAVACSCGSPGVVVDLLETGLGSLEEEMRGFLRFENSCNYSEVSSKIISFVEGCVSGWVKQNPNMSKEAANRRAIMLVLLMFSNSARGCIRASGCGTGTVALDILVAIEKQLETNVNTKVLIESLAARWANCSEAEECLL